MVRPTGGGTVRTVATREVSALLFASATASAQSVWARSDSTAARQAIEPEWVRIIDQCKRGDWAGLSAGFTNDGVYVYPESHDLVGQVALRATFEKTLGSKARLVTLTRDVTHFIVDGDIALEGAASTEEWREIGKPGTERIVLRYLYVWKRQPDGHWRIRYLMETPVAPNGKQP
jgi:ketosteroid isomerase-like protein